LGRGAGQADCVEVLAKQTNECERLNWLGGRDSLAQPFFTKRKIQQYQPIRCTSTA
jgi:hypothetical protein